MNAPAQVENTHDIDDCTEAVGTLPFDVEEMERGMCPRNPAGQCEFARFDDFTRCIHCGREARAR